MEHAYHFCVNRVCGGVQTTYVDKRVGQSILAFGPRDMIGQTFYGPTLSTDNINAMYFQLDLLT